jgi:hypothetical protein
MGSLGSARGVPPVNGHGQDGRGTANDTTTTAGEVVGPKTEAEKRHAKLSGEVTSKPFAESLDFAKVQEAVQLIACAREKLSKLRDRKNALGLK